MEAKYVSNITAGQTAKIEDGNIEYTDTAGRDGQCVCAVINLNERTIIIRVGDQVVYQHYYGCMSNLMRFVVGDITYYSVMHPQIRLPIRLAIMDYVTATTIPAHQCRLWTVDSASMREAIVSELESLAVMMDSYAFYVTDGVTGA